MEKQRKFRLKFCMDDKQVQDTVLNVQMIYILSGNMAVRLGTESFAAHGGDFFALNAGQSFWRKCDTECLYARLEMKYRLFADRLGTSYIYILCNSILGNMDPAVYKKVKRVVEQLVREYASVPETTGFRREYLWFGLMDILSRNCMLHTPEFIDSIEAGQRMILAMQYICANYGSDLTLKETADQMHLSPSAFSRWFKRQSGFNYGEFVQQVRMAHSIEDLLYTNKNITEIAGDSGFASSSVFTKVFKSIYKVTPTRYRALYAGTDGDDTEFKSRVLSNPGFLAIQENNGETDIRKIYADSRKGIVLKDTWTQAINAGNAQHLLFARMQAQILDLKNNLGLKYIRIDNIFSEKLHLRKGHVTGHLNYDMLDEIIDFLVSNHIHPIIDLCDREKNAFLAIDEVLYHEQLEGVFETEQEMLWIVQNVFEHFVSRYGIQEVRRWPVECWYDNRKDRIMGLRGNYARIFQQIFNTIKAVIPEISVGGCGLELGVSERYFRSIIRELVQRKCIPDFISMYIYPYIETYSQISDFDYTMEKLNLCRNILNEYHIKHRNIYVMEWNSSVSARNFYNDSCAKASMLLRHAASSVNGAKMFLYSMFSDRMTNYYDSFPLLFGAPGLVTKNGLYKPVYYALWFLKHMTGNLLSSGKEHMVSVDENGVYHILLFSAKALNYKYYLKKEYKIRPEDFDELFEDDADFSARLEISHVKQGKYEEKQYILDTEHGSLLDQWMTMGMPETLTTWDLQYLKSVTRPQVIFKKCQSFNETLVIKESLQPHQIKYIEIYPQ